MKLYSLVANCRHLFGRRQRDIAVVNDDGVVVAMFYELVDGMDAQAMADAFLGAYRNGQPRDNALVDEMARNAELAEQNADLYHALRTLAEDPLSDDARALARSVLNTLEAAYADAIAS